MGELTRFTRRIDAAHQAARLWAGTPLGTAGPGFDARYARVQDTPLLDFINDVQRRKAGAQLSAAAVFDVQPGLPEGEIHQRELSGIYPYENTLRAVKISGQQLRDYLEQSARYFRTYEPGGPGGPIINDSFPPYNYDVVSGVVYNIDLSRPVGQRIRGLAYEGKIVQPSDSFGWSFIRSPPGGSTFSTSAPKSPSSIVAIGPTSPCEASSTRTPAYALTSPHPHRHAAVDRQAAVQAGAGGGAPGARAE